MVVKRENTMGLLVGIALVSATAGFSNVVHGAPGYWTTESGEIQRTQFGDCWRTQWWTEADALPECGDVVDSDGDGVKDELDRCPGTAKGVRVDAQGCELDSDNDGVKDSLDQCPNSAPGAEVDAKGCELPKDQDRDGDGVMDSVDQCLQTPPGVRVNAQGCEIKVLDSDGDGVLDPNDRCPNTPAGRTVDAQGCEVQEKDSDGDGVVDRLDRCPQTVSGATVDVRGCELDSDKDSIVDRLDRCPGTAAGARVDGRGCELEETIELRGVNFASSSARLVGESNRVLDEMAETLKRYSTMKVEVAGHTDSSGSRAFNKTLSQRRAEAVLNYLVSKGVPAANLTAKGYGPDQPVAENETRAGRAKNRRVELRILEQ